MEELQKFLKLFLERYKVNEKSTEQNYQWAGKSNAKPHFNLKEITRSHEVLLKIFRKSTIDELYTGEIRTLHWNLSENFSQSICKITESPTKCLRKPMKTMETVVKFRKETLKKLLKKKRKECRVFHWGIGDFWAQSQNIVGKNGKSPKLNGQTLKPINFFYKTVLKNHQVFEKSIKKVKNCTEKNLEKIKNEDQKVLQEIRRETESRPKIYSKTFERCSKNNWEKFRKKLEQAKIW